MKRHYLKATTLFSSLLYLVSTLCLLSCTGGDNSTAPNEANASDVNSGYQVEIALFNENTGEPTTSISTTEPGEILITVTQFRRASASEIVSLSSTTGTIGVSTGTVLTNTEGQARARITSAGIDGAGTITATFTPSGGRTISVGLNFTSVGGAVVSDPDSINIALSITSDSGVTNVIRGDDPGTATATVTNQNGTPITNTIVTFSGNLVAFNPSTGTALTNDEGVATIGLLSGDQIGISTISAAIAQGEGTLSESVNITIEQPTIQLGNGSDTNFTQGILGLSLNTLSAGGTVSIVADIVDANNQPFTTPVNIQFSSPCVTQEQASIDALVTTVNGQATSTYRALGCVGNDLITATIDFGGAQFTASVNLTVQGDDAGSIIFSEASPETIVLAGTGGQGLRETSSVTFQVFGEQGLPIANQEVAFSLSTDVGGITFNPATATSDADGFVSTTVQSGNIATSVVVIATLVDLDVSTQSAALAVSSGLADQNSMSISLSQANPEALIHDGENITVTARAADIFNNPVPDGITFSFTVEGGQIEPSCISVDGGCSVTWTSQNPKPDDGLVTMMVSTIGGESFQDENGNGVFDDGDGFDDLTEAFRDDNTNDERDFGEPFIDFNGNDTFDIEDGLYGGPLCEDSVRCAPVAGATVSASTEFVMSGSEAVYTFDPPRAGGSDSVFYTSLDPILLTVNDVNGNSMPGGTTIEITSEIGQLIGETSFTIDQSAREPKTIQIIINLDDVVPAIGTSFLTVTTTTPKEIKSTQTYRFSYDINATEEPET